MGDVVLMSIDTAHQRHSHLCPSCVREWECRGAAPCPEVGSAKMGEIGYESMCGECQPVVGGRHPDYRSEGVGDSEY